MPEHRTPSVVPIRPGVILTVPFGGVVHSAGDWHIVGSEDGQVFGAYNRHDGSRMPVQMLSQLQGAPVEFVLPDDATR